MMAMLSLLESETSLEDLRRSPTTREILCSPWNICVETNAEAGRGEREWMGQTALPVAGRREREWMGLRPPRQATLFMAFSQCSRAQISQSEMRPFAGSLTRIHYSRMEK